MTTRTKRASIRQTMEVSGIAVDVLRKDIKNLHLAVYPPDGGVRVAAPLRLTDEAIRLAIVTRLGWIRRRQDGFGRQERQSERQMVSGESHYVFGHRYRLDVIQQDRPPAVRIRNNRTLELVVRPGTDRQGREAVINRWYRQLLRDRLQQLVPKWEAIIGVQVAQWRIKRMKTRWGTCNASTRRIWLNLELAKKPPSCLEYILVHEMVHLLERHHNDRFIHHMDTSLPNGVSTAPL